MRLKIPEHISENEILVHFLYNRNFPKNTIIATSLISKEIFIPNKGGVSMQRHLFCNENNCKYFAKNYQFQRVYVGFLLLRKKDFNYVKKEYISNSRKDFEAEIISTPINEKGEYYPKSIDVFTDSLGNPAHSDLIYINPAPEGEETPKTAIRSFSRKLAKKCVVTIDQEPQEVLYNSEKFSKLI